MTGALLGALFVYAWLISPLLLGAGVLWLYRERSEHGMGK